VKEKRSQPGPLFARAAAAAGLALALVFALALGAPGGALAQFTSPQSPAHVTSLSGCTNVSASGGQITCSGGPFDLSVAPVLNLLQSGKLMATAATMSGWTSSSFTAVVPATTAGTYDALITEYGGSWSVSYGIVTTTSILTPSEIYSTNLVGQYTSATPASAKCSGVACACGGTVTTWTDVSGTGQNLTCSGGVTYTCADSVFPGTPNTLVFDGTSGTCSLGSFSLSSATILYGIGGLYYTGNPFSTGGLFWGYSNQTLFAGTNSGAVISTWIFNADQRAWNNATQSTPIIGIFGDSYSGGTHTLAISADNGTPLTQSFSNSALPTSASMSIGGTGGSHYASQHTPEWHFVNVVPSSTQLTEDATYLNLTYGITTPPSLTYVTPLQSGVSGVTFRMQGSHFESGLSASLGCGVGAVTVVDTVGNPVTTIDATSPSITCGSPPCSCDVTITNPDGYSRTFNGAATVNATANPETILGTSLLTWLEASSITLSGSNVSGFTDLSGLGNNATQGTSADQATTVTASDANFNGQQTVTSAGSPVYYDWPSPMLSSVTATAMYEWQATKLNSASSATNQTMLLACNQHYLWLNGPTLTNRAASNYANATSATWGTTGGTSPHFLATRLTGTGTFTVGILSDTDAPGSEVTNTGSGTPTYTCVTTGGDTVSFLAQGTSENAQATTAFFAFADVAPTTAQSNAMCLYVQSKFLTGIACP